MFIFCTLYALSIIDINIPTLYSSANSPTVKNIVNNNHCYSVQIKLDVLKQDMMVSKYKLKAITQQESNGVCARATFAYRQNKHEA